MSTTENNLAISMAPLGINPEDGEMKLLGRYLQTRAFTEALTEGLFPEDMVVQSMPDVSPTKWHLAHTAWFFERFVLMNHAPGYQPLDETYLYLFNSYYQQAGERHCRDQRGYISRPTVDEVKAYRHRIDDAMATLLSRADDDTLALLDPLVTIGIHHEQQHQELLLTDLKHVFAVNPLRPVYRKGSENSSSEDRSVTEPLNWIAFGDGVHSIGHDGDGFSYDNETPRHRQFLEPYQLADRLVTCGEYLEFMQDGGYRLPELWLSLGWATVEEKGWTEPFYWEQRDGQWMVFTLAGMKPVDPAEPVCHLSYYEADAFARWSGARLPTEAEWEVAAATLPINGNFVEDENFHPTAAPPASGLKQMFGDLWEWTSSSYAPYPGFRPLDGALGEYNGKFMCNQYVLRGGSCATSRSHIRPTYRNFFPPEATWQFTGLRLARSIDAKETR